jgi:hypothetical protein
MISGGGTDAYSPAWRNGSLRRATNPREKAYQLPELPPPPEPPPPPEKPPPPPDENPPDEPPPELITNPPMLA